MTTRTLFASEPSGRLQRWLQPSRVLGGLFLLSLLVYLALIPIPRVDGQLIGSDGVGYYVYARSLVLDHDLDFANEYAHYRAAITDQGLTPIGRAANKYAIGPALLWMPFFLAAHLVATLGHALGLGGAPDGYGYLYQAAISIGSIVYGALGFGLAHLCARRLFSVESASIAVALLWLASNAIYYMVFEPSMSHMVSLFSVAALLSAWSLWFRGPIAPTARQAALLGAAGGLVPLVRLQDVIFLLLPYGHLLIRLTQAWAAGQRRQASRWLGCGLIAGTLTLLVFLPQLLAWQRLYGTVFTSPYMSDHDPAFYWLRPRVAQVLFSTFHGLFTWHPVLLIALLGLPSIAARDRWLALAAAGLLALDLYVVAAWWAWWQGDSFGGRMFLNAMWIWVLGLAGLVERLRWRPRLLLPAILVGLLLIAWNGLSLAQYRLGLVPMSAPLTWEQMTIERLKLPWALLNRD